MPKTKNPKKNNSVAETVVTTDPATTKPESTVTAQTAASPSSQEENNTEMKAALLKKTRRPEIVKSDKSETTKVESRSKLVPINIEDEIRRLAYLLSERRGFQPGHEAEDWLNAEREVQQRYHQHSA